MAVGFIFFKVQIWDLKACICSSEEAVVQSFGFAGRRILESDFMIFK